MAAANELMQHYTSTPYAKIAAFALAQQAVNAYKFDEASTPLRWAIQHSDQAFLSQLARIRLAQILLNQNKPQAALEAIKEADKIYPVEAGLIKAQALLALNKIAEARLALQKAIDTAPTDSSMRAILEMYLNDLPNPKEP
jgi:predicted negative regulator of RcsB-dependent stress response